MLRQVLCGLASCLVLGSWAPARADDAEDKAIAFVEERYGQVTRDDTRPGKPVTGVRLLNAKVTDTDIKVLVGLKNLSELDLGLTKVSDAGIATRARCLRSANSTSSAPNLGRGPEASGPAPESDRAHCGRRGHH